MFEPNIFANSFVSFIKHSIWLLFISLASFSRLIQYILLLTDLRE